MTERTLLKYYADYYHEMGLNISFLSNETSKYNFLFDAKRLKAPFYEWKRYQSERQNKDILNGYDWDKCFGIGIILGFNGIAAIDLDGCVNEEIVKFILDYLELPQYYEWVIKSGSQAGYHILFKTGRPDISDKRLPKTTLGYYQPLDDTFGKVDVNAYYPLDNMGEDVMQKERQNEISQRLINNNSFEKIEFKWNGHIIIPPSIHSSGRSYAFLYRTPENEPRQVSFESLSELQIQISGLFAQDSSKNGKEATTDEEDISIVGPCALVVDCETNGLPIDFNKSYDVTDNWPRLLQISWLVCGRNFRSSYYTVETLNLIKRQIRNVVPKNFDIDPDAELVHGLTSEFLNELGEDLKGVLRKFIEDVKKCSIIVGHNLNYDLNVIKCELLRCGMEVSFLEEKELCCTMENSVDMCKLGKAPYKFPSLSELFFTCFDKKISVEHNSIFDAFLTMKCYNQIGVMKDKQEFQEYLNYISRKRKEFDNRFDKLSGPEKLKLAIEENEYFPNYNEQSLSTIEKQDVLLITKQERENLYKRVKRITNTPGAKRWANIKDLIESIDFSF